MGLIDRVTPSTGEPMCEAQSVAALTRRQAIGALVYIAMAGPTFALEARPTTTDPGIYFDSNGLVVQRDGDGGDTAQREGWAWFGIWLRTVNLKKSSPVVLPISFDATMNLLEDPRRPGQFRRHPTQPGFKSDPDAFSRDQIIPLVAAMGVWGDQSRLKRSWAAKRPCHLVLTCVQGTQDILGPDLVNLYRRAWGEAPDPTGDKVLALGMADRLRQANANPEDVGDDLNLIVQLLMAKVRAPSADTELATTTYAKNRPVCAGCYLSHYRKAYPGDYGANEATMKSRIKAGIASGWKTDCPRVLGALRWYFRPESGGCSSLAELYEPMVNEWLT
jgi:hypothetical protein